VRKIVGVDYAPSMVKRCKELFPQVDVTTAEVRNLPFQKDTFDKIVCFSVFQYFPDLEYSKEALAEFIRVCKPGGRVFIGDVPDEKTKAASLNYRQKVGRHAGWHSSIKADLHHIYYKREFFKNFLKTRGIKCMVSQQDIPGYGNSPFRFNVIFENEK
jgi:ubiquinone/menaquinone biosynthesis C-methylase UbiE